MWLLYACDTALWRTRMWFVGAWSGDKAVNTPDPVLCAARALFEADKITQRSAAMVDSFY